MADLLLFCFAEKYTPEDISEVFKEINKQTGEKIYYILQKPYGQAGYVDIPEVAGVQGPYINRFMESVGGRDTKDTLGSWDYNAVNEEMKSFSQSVHDAGKDWWVWITPNFDNRSEWSRTIYEYYPSSHFNGDNMNVFKKQMFLASQYNPNGVIITSWNCFGENTAFEAQWDGDGYRGDPFYRQKLIAGLKGIKWQDPPLPDKEIVDPLLWWKIYGIDKNGPIIPKSEVRFGDLIVDCEDNSSLPEKLLVGVNGKAFYKMTDDGDKAKGIELLNPENAVIEEMYGLKFIAPKEGSLKFRVDKGLINKDVHIVLRYDGKADTKERMITYPSIVDDYVDKVGDTHEGMLPKFWLIDREESPRECAKITIEPLTHLDYNRDFIVEIRMPVNLLGFESPHTDRIVTEYSDIEGLRKRFRQRLWSDIQLNDIFVLRGVDGLGNIGFPSLLDLDHIGY